MHRLMALAQSLQLYYEGHAAQENAPLSVTADVAGDLFSALSAARSTVNACATDEDGKKTERDQAVAPLRKRLRGLVDELTLLLGANDPRWQAFGLNMPGAEETPETPVFTASNGATGHLVLDVQETPRADYFHVFTQRVGIDANPALQGSYHDRHIDLNSYTPGMTVRVEGSAINNGGESPRSQAVEMAVT